MWWLQFELPLDSAQHWMHWLYGNSFTIVMNHRALCYLLTPKRLNRCLYGFQGLGHDYPGLDKANADGLSLQAWDEVEEDQEIATEDDSVEYAEEADNVEDTTPFNVPSS